MSLAPNRFDLLRLLFAALVFAYHAVVLSVFAPGGELESGLALLAELSIQGFFIVSGALVYGSFERSTSLMDYAGKRVRRLYPAYAVVIVVPAMIALVLSLGTGEGTGQVFHYLWANLIFLNFLQPELPGLFEGNRFPEVNGALWTLKIEVMFYAVLPVLAWGIAKLKRHWWVGIAGLIIAAMAWQEWVLAWSHPLSEPVARQLPGQMMYFAAGMALWRLWGDAQRHAFPLLVIGLISLGLALFVPGLDMLRVLGLAGFIAGVAFMEGPPLNTARWGDISYGVYIVHFPVVQVLVALGVFSTFGPIAGFALSALIVTGLSLALWWWVEKPALRRDSHYRRMSEEGSQ